MYRGTYHGALGALHHVGAGCIFLQRARGFLYNRRGWDSRQPKPTKAKIWSNMRQPQALPSGEIPDENVLVFRVERADRSLERERPDSNPRSTLLMRLRYFNHPAGCSATVEEAEATMKITESMKLIIFCRFAKKKKAFKVKRQMKTSSSVMKMISCSRKQRIQRPPASEDSRKTMIALAGI